MASSQRSPPEAENISPDSTQSPPTGSASQNQPQAKDEEPPPAVIFVAESLSKLGRFPKTAKGYSHLLWFMAFNLLYAVIVALEVNVGPSYIVDSSLRVALGPSVAKIRTLDDFWNFFLVPETEEGLLSDLFADRAANGELLSAAQVGYYLTYNKVLGGVAIVQSRGEKKSCDEINGWTAYLQYYPSCYTSEESQADFSKSKSPTPDTLSAYKYNTTYGGYAMFLPVSQGRASALSKAKELWSGLWLDRATRTVAVKFCTYTAMLKVFSSTLVLCSLHRGGVVSCSLSVQSFDMEPFRGRADYGRLVIELLFIVWLSRKIAAFLFSVVARGSRWRLSFVLHLSHLSLLAAYIIVRIQHYGEITNRGISEESLTNYSSVFDTLSSLRTSLLSLNFFIVIVAMLRFFEMTEFHSRLSLVPQSLSNVSIDLSHFAALALIAFFGLATAGHFLFGHFLEDFSSFGSSLMALALSIFGIFPLSQNSHNIFYTNRGIGTLWYGVFAFVFVISALTLLLVIVLEGYSHSAVIREGEEGSDGGVAGDLGEAMSVWISASSSSDALASKNLLLALSPFKGEKTVGVAEYLSSLRRVTGERNEKHVRWRNIKTSPLLQISEFTPQQVAVKTISPDYQIHVSLFCLSFCFSQYFSSVSYFYPMPTNTTQVGREIQRLLRENATLRHSFNVSTVTRPLKSLRINRSSSTKLSPPLLSPQAPKPPQQLQPQPLSAPPPAPAPSAPPAVGPPLEVASVSNNALLLAQSLPLPPLSPLSPTLDDEENL